MRKCLYNYNSKYNEMQINTYYGSYCKHNKHNKKVRKCRSFSDPKKAGKSLSGELEITEVGPV